MTQDKLQIVRIMKVLGVVLCLLAWGYGCSVIVLSM